MFLYFFLNKLTKTKFKQDHGLAKIVIPIDMAERSKFNQLNNLKKFKK